ncbi:MAG: LarC family nickel insertion protein [Deltaproteobacteria bacterium]|nr:LarC family nickel insertion protein [Deltaproteobacteria bacterium]
MARHLHLSPQPDLSPGLFLGALVDLGAPAAALHAELDRVGWPGAARPRLTFRRAETDAGEGTECGGEAGDLPLAQARSWAQGSALPAGARRRFDAALDLLARPGAGHEGEPLGLLAAAILALDLLDVTSVTSDPLPVSGAWTRPATLAVLRGAAVHGVTADREPVTPLGAVLAACLADAFGPLPALTLEASGLGVAPPSGSSGERRLRLYLGHPLQAGPTRESLLVLEANLDDLSPELLATLPDTCLEAGALDAWLTPALMKKGRPAHCLSALCTEDAAAAVEEAIFRHSSTLGVRRLRVERDALARVWEEVETPWGSVRVKIGLLEGAPVNRAPEFEDCRARAREAGVPLKQVYAAAMAAARR